MFALDRDLIVLEPALLRDVAWAGQRVLDTTATLAGDTLTVASGSLEASGVDAGSVVLFDALPIEVVARLSPTQAAVSLLRARRDSSPIPPPAAASRPCRVYSFAPQRELVHRQVLAMIGIDPDGAGPLTEAAVTNPNALARLEALGALHLIYAGAGAPGVGADPFAARAAAYRQRFGEERERAVALIDLNADGVAETARRPTVFTLTRA